MLAAAREGTEWAWDEVYRDLAPVVFGYLRGQRAPDPEDLTGEVFLQVVRDLHRFQGHESGFRSWVLTIAHHRLLDARRRAARRPVEPTPPREVARALPPIRADDDVLDELAMGSVLALLDRLTTDQRTVLLLRVVSQLTIEEIAEVTGRRPEAVKALQRRGLEALRRLLGTSPYQSASSVRSPG